MVSVESCVDLKPAGTGEYVVQDGDSIESIAFQHGFFPETLWRLPENQEVAAARKDRNVLLPGDRLHVPDPRVAVSRCATDLRHRFRRKGVPAKFRIQVLDDGRPQAGAPYEFAYNGVQKSGALDGAGYFEQWIPPDLTEASLVVKLDLYTLKYRLRFGYLYPIEGVIGVKQRLANLGYYRDAIDDELSPELACALVDFQRDYKLPETGELTEETRAKLLNIHDSR